VFYIGQHETLRTVPLSTDLISASQDLGYDFLTTPITSLIFQERVVSLVSNHFDSIKTSNGASSTPLPSLQPFTPEDTCITPDDGNISLVAIASPWIDLGSTDPIIRHVSRQVLSAELAYAAFCGISNILIFGPLPDSDVIQYARAIYEGLGLGPYLNLHILLPVTGELEQDHVDGVHLSDLANGTNGYDSEELEEAFGVWNVWNTIRTICNYSNKLSIGKTRHCIDIGFIYISSGPSHRRLHVAILHKLDHH
jgi:protein arginine N-methyltransferase 5